MVEVKNNGNVVSGRDVVIISDAKGAKIDIGPNGVYMDGKKISSNPVINESTQIIINGSCQDVRADGVGRVMINGDIEGKVTVNGNLEIKGDVTGDIRSNGSVRCQSVSGNVTTEGTVKCDRIGGNVTARSTLISE